MSYFVEITDTFGGEANYSWVTRYKVRASSARGAVWRISRESGLSWRKEYDTGDLTRYNSASGSTCLFVSDWDDEQHGDYSDVNLSLS